MLVQMFKSLRGLFGVHHHQVPVATRNLRTAPRTVSAPGQGHPSSTVRRYVNRKLHEEMADIPAATLTPETTPEHYNAGVSGHLATLPRKGPGATNPALRTQRSANPPHQPHRTTPVPRRHRQFQAGRPTNKSFQGSRPDIPKNDGIADADPAEDPDKSSFSKYIWIGGGLAVAGALGFFLYFE